MARPTIHGHRPRDHHSPTYVSWKSMRSRCWGNGNESYIGVDYDPRWDDFTCFLEDMGERPKGTTLDRKNPNLGYYKDNCRWATPRQQSNNIKTNRIIKIGAFPFTASEWSEITGIPYRTIMNRLYKGWSEVDAITKPVNRQKITRGTPAQ